ncbi:AIPR family protein [Helicobacter cinaedi]|uniref:AIPR family protein n=1 Tax=Helicobacter cinaedi TaxID=213 RepID=UPI0009DB134E
MTIICDNIQYQGKKDVSIILKNIQIVNGGQTIHSLKEVLSQNDNIENVSVLYKIYQTNSKRLKAKISEFTNNQNPVKWRDIRSIDELQIKLENEFRILGYYYERKKNQYKNYPKKKRIDSEKIGQVLLCI